MYKKYIDAVDKCRSNILSALDFVWKHPETGFREYKTSAYMEEAFERLGYTLVRAGDIPGFYTVIDTGRPGPEILVMGELDALLCAEHPDADPETGAVHCCGHAAQCAALLGLAEALKQPGILDEMSGRIRLCAVPAEELIENEYRLSLKAEGKIHSLGGKVEFLHRGYFDGVDVAFMVHTAEGDDNFSARAGSVGCITKRIVYKGKSAHAGGSPWNGCNALYAATLGLSAINSIRETFKESDLIRVHPIVTKGGSAVNAIPNRVIIESYVRGATFDAILKANKRVNRALCGAALSMGANVDIQDVPGYAPLINSADMVQLASEACREATGKTLSYSDTMGTGSTDMGDLSCIMPVVHPYAPGASGTGHGSDYRIANPERACVDSAKWQIVMLAMLLENGGERAKQIAANFHPMFASKEAYFEYVDKMWNQGDRIDYGTDKKAVVTLD